MSGSIGATGLALSGILVAVTVALSFWRRLGLHRDILIACARAVGQLWLVGIALALVIDDDAPLGYSAVWVAAMIGYAAYSTQRRVGPGARVLPLAVAAYVVAVATSGAVLFGLGVFPIEGRTVVPLAGMMIGNSLGATALVASRLSADRVDHRAEIEARLALGLPADQAFAPHLRRSLRQALIPQIEKTSAVGIVFLPGAMVGLILAGTPASDAVLVQAAVMFLVLGSVAITTTVMALGLERAFFTSDHRLVDPEDTALGDTALNDPALNDPVSGGTANGSAVSDDTDPDGPVADANANPRR